MIPPIYLVFELIKPQCSNIIVQNALILTFKPINSKFNIIFPTCTHSDTNTIWYLISKTQF